MISSIDSNSVRQIQQQRPNPEDIFKKMDADDDGSVSKAEFESAFVQISQKGGQAADGAAGKDSAALKIKADEIYAKMDADGDGSLSATEFEAAAKAHEAGRGQGGARGPHGGGASAAAGSAEKSTDPADTNKDGVVSAQEAAAYEIQQAAAKLSASALNAVQTYGAVAEGT